MVRFVSLRVWFEDHGLSYIFTQVAMQFSFDSYYTNPPLYWLCPCYHLIMDLYLCLVAMIVFSRYLLPWICIVLVNNHVMSHLRFESMVLQQLPSNILSFDLFTLQSIHLSHSYNFMLWGEFCYTEILSS